MFTEPDFQPGIRGRKYELPRTKIRLKRKTGNLWAGMRCVWTAQLADKGRTRGKGERTRHGTPQKSACSSWDRDRCRGPQISTRKIEPAF